MIHKIRNERIRTTGTDALVLYFKASVILFFITQRIGSTLETDFKFLFYTEPEKNLFLVI